MARMPYGIFDTVGHNVEWWVFGVLDRVPLSSGPRSDGSHV